jgi:hypothetical protein
MGHVQLVQARKGFNRCAGRQGRGALVFDSAANLPRPVVVQVQISIQTKYSG